MKKKTLLDLKNEIDKFYAGKKNNLRKYNISVEEFRALVNLIYNNGQEFISNNIFNLLKAYNQNVIEYGIGYMYLKEDRQ